MTGTSLSRFSQIKSPDETTLPCKTHTPVGVDLQNVFRPPPVMEAFVRIFHFNPLLVISRYE